MSAIDFAGRAARVAAQINRFGNTCAFSGGKTFKAAPDEQNRKFRSGNQTEGVDADEANLSIFILPPEALTAGLESETFTYLGATYKVRKVEPEGYGDVPFQANLLCDRVS